MADHAPERLRLRVQSIAADLGVTPNYDQFSIRAICHGDHDPSGLSIGAKDSDGRTSRDGYPLITCHAGCSYATVRSALMRAGVSSKWLRPSDAAPVAARRAVQTALPRTEFVRYVPDEIWLRAYDALHERHKDKLGYLIDERGLTIETIRAMALGWHRGRYSIPVFDEEARCVTLRLYKPRSDHKMIYLDGHGKNRLFIPGDTLDPDRRTLYCAGEWDAILAYQQGWQTVTHTGGESARPPEVDLHRLKGQWVVTAYDNDDAGAAGAVKTAAVLSTRARSVAIADLSPYVGAKGDVSDLLLSGEVLSAAVDAAELWATETSGRQETDWAHFWANDPKPIRYLVPPLFAAGEITRVFAPAKVGKSLLVLEAMAALSTGRTSWANRLKPPEWSTSTKRTLQDDWRDRLQSMGYGPCRRLESAPLVQPPELAAS